MNGHNESGILDRRFETLCLCYQVHHTLFLSSATGAKSAYKIQFTGSFEPLSNLFWKAEAENKCKLFAWTLVQNKL